MKLVSLSTGCKKNESGIITAYVRKSERSNIESHSCDLRPPVLASTCLDAVFGSDMSLTEKWDYRNQDHLANHCYLISQIF